MLRHARHAYVLLALVLAGLATSRVACAAEVGAVQEPTLRAPARIYIVTMPTFPETGVEPGKPLEVKVRLRVEETGSIVDARVVSPPSGADKSVLDAVAYWAVLPDVCHDSTWTAAEVRATVIFSIEDGQEMITIHDAGWYATGSDTVLAEVNHGSAEKIRMRRPLATPEFPKALLRRGIRRGEVAAVLQFDGDGRMQEVVRLYSRPPGLFDDAVKRAVAEWQIAPDDPRVLQHKPTRTCVQFSFSVQ